MYDSMTVSISSVLNNILKNIENVTLADEELEKCDDFTKMGFDSLSLMRIVVECEKVFNIEFFNDELDFDTINNYSRLKKLLESKLI